MGYLYLEVLSIWQSSYTLLIQWERRWLINGLVMDRRLLSNLQRASVDIWRECNNNLAKSENILEHSNEPLY